MGGTPAPDGAFYQHIGIDSLPPKQNSLPEIPIFCD